MIMLMMRDSCSFHLLHPVSVANSACVRIPVAYIMSFCRHSSSMLFMF